METNCVALKLNKTNAMLSKLRHVLDINTLRSLYYPIFDSLLRYTSLVLVQDTNSVKRLHLLSKNTSEWSFRAEIPK